MSSSVGVWEDECRYLYLGGETEANLMSSNMKVWEGVCGDQRTTSCHPQECCLLPLRQSLTSLELIN